MQGNSIRLRLSQGEVARFHAEGRVEDAIAFPGAARLAWMLEASGAVLTPEAAFGDGVIRVLLPAAVAARWATSNEVGIYTQRGAPGLAITVEKDFQCLHPDPHTGQRDADAFPNPAAG